MHKSIHRLSQHPWIWTQTTCAPTHICKAQIHAQCIYTPHTHTHTPKKNKKTNKVCNTKIVHFHPRLEGQLPPQKPCLVCDKRIMTNSQPLTMSFATHHPRPNSRLHTLTTPPSQIELVSITHAIVGWHKRTTKATSLPLNFSYMPPTFPQKPCTSLRCPIPILAPNSYPLWSP